MNNIDKTILLAESFGADTSLFTSSYVDSIVKSTAYLTLVNNVAHADRFKLIKSAALVEDFKSLDYRIDTFKQAVILSARVNYLYSVSNESYYLNPLVSYDFEIKTKSIGELRCLYDGERKTFNEVIEDQSHTLGYKSRAIAGQCEYFRRELTDKIGYNYSKTQENKGMGDVVRKSTFGQIIRLIVALLTFAPAVYTLLSRRERFVKVYTSFQPTSLWDWGLLMYLISSSLLLAFSFWEFARHNKIYAPYYYFKRFGERKITKVGEQIAASAQKMAEYIFLACKTGQKLGFDIKRFGVGKTMDSELKAYGAMYKARDDKVMKATEDCYRIFLILTIIWAFLCLVDYLVVRFILK